MKTHNTKETIIKVTELLEKKNRFAFVSYTRSAFFSIVGDIKGDKKPPKHFVQSILKGITSTESNFMAAMQPDFINSQEDKVGKVGLKDKTFYDSCFLENYINENYDIFKTFMQYYFKHNKVLVISFQHKSNIGKFFAKDSAFIQVPYNDFYDKLDSVLAQVSEFENEYSMCILDCPMFASAIAPKLWEKTNMSILDLGKTLTVARAFDRNKEASVEEQMGRAPR
jgi:hypothetical protein